MITEDYVSFETAKLLKEKGFDEICEYEYGVPNVDKGYVLQRFFKPIKNSELIDDAYTAPTLQMAMKWLREEHNQIIVPSIRVEDTIPGKINCYIVGIWYIPENNGGAFCYTSPTPYNGYPSFEEACEAGIRYCLENLI